MKRDLYAALIVATLFIGASRAGQVEGGPKSPPHGGGKAASHMSDKGSANTNAQWSADPERGWVRAEERREVREERHPSPPSQPRKNQARHRDVGVVGDY